jgi:hypothetical protein
LEHRRECIFSIATFGGLKLATLVQDIVLALGINNVPYGPVGFVLDHVSVEPNCLTNGLFYTKIGDVSIGPLVAASFYNANDGNYSELMHRRLMGFGFQWWMPTLLTPIGGLYWGMRINSLYAGIPCHIIWTHS